MEERCKDTHRSHHEHETLTEVEAGISIKHATGLVPVQSDHFVVDDIERKALAHGRLEFLVEEIKFPLEETPSVEELDAWELGKIMLFILGASRVVDGGGSEESSHAKGGSHEFVVFAGDEMKDGGIEGRHGVGDGGDGRGSHGRTISILRVPENEG